MALKCYCRHFGSIDAIAGEDRLSRDNSQSAERNSVPRSMNTKRKSEKGQSLVEFALALPILLVLLLGILKGGTTFYNWITLAESVQVGGRTLAVSRLDNPNGCSLATTALQNAAVNLSGNTNITPSYTFSGNGGSSCTNLVAGDSATVTATYACNLQILWYNFAPNCTLKSTITERIE